MSVVVIDGSTVRAFVEDVEAFNKVVDKSFRDLDVNSDGVLSRAELRTAVEQLHLVESHLGMPESKTPDELNALYDSVFTQFDTDSNGKIELAEFRSSMRDIMLAIATGLGNSPLRMVVDEGGMLQSAAAHEAASTNA